MYGTPAAAETVPLRTRWGLAPMGSGPTGAHDRSVPTRRLSSPAGRADRLDRTRYCTRLGREGRRTSDGLATPAANYPPPPSSAEGEPLDGAHRRFGRRPVFASAVCLAGIGVAGRAARHQAAALVPLGGVRSAPLASVSRDDGTAVIDRCASTDLLVLCADQIDDAAFVLAHATKPVLLARTCRSGASVTDRILLAVDDSSESRHAAQLAGALAVGHEGTITILAALEPNPALQRAVAASVRIVIDAGVAPHVSGDYVAPERAIPAAAIALQASLVVVPLESDAGARRQQAALIARRVCCSTLAVPSPTGSM